MPTSRLFYREFRAAQGRGCRRRSVFPCSCGRSAGPSKRPKARAKSKAKAGARIPRPRLPQALEQRHLDLIGLFLIAAGVYLSFVLFFGWEGGKVGYGLETGLTYLVGDVGARIFTILMLVIGVVLVTGTSIGSILRGFGRGTRRVVVGSRGMAETVVRTREDRATEPETRAGPTDVMSTYPEEEDDFEPTVAIGSFDDDVAEAEEGTQDLPVVEGDEPEAEEEPDPVAPEDSEAPTTEVGPHSDGQTARRHHLG